MRRRFGFLVAMVALAALALPAGPAAAGHRHGEKHRISVGHDHDGQQVDLEDGWLLFRHDDHPREEVAISADGDLEVNGEAVRVDARDREALREFHLGFVEILDSATALGEEAAEVGVAGAALGAKALAKVIRLLDEDYDEADLEREMDAEEAKIEAVAAKLEAKGEAIEELADEWEADGRALKRRIPELREIDWFLD